MLTLFRNLFTPPRHMILLVIAAWVGLTLAEKRTERHGISKDDLNNLTFYGLLAFVIGGRISFALQNLPSFSKSPLSIFSVNPDLFDVFGGMAATVLAALIYGQRKKLSFWPVLDSLTILFAVLSVGVGLSHLAAGTAFGSPTDMPWAIDLWSANRHPTQIYEIIASLLIFGLLWRNKPGQHPGIFFLNFLALTSAAHLFIGGFRGDSTIVLNGLRQNQLIAWALLAIAFILLEIRLRERPQASATKRAD